MAKTANTDNIFYLALEMCEKYELPKTPEMTKALSEMYREGVVWASNVMDEAKAKAGVAKPPQSERKIP